MQEVFGRAVRPFRVEVVGGDFEDIDWPVDSRECDITWEHQFHWRTVEVTKRRRRDVKGKPKYPAIFAQQQRVINTARRKYKCDAVVLVWHNGQVRRGARGAAPRPALRPR